MHLRAGALSARGGEEHPSRSDSGALAPRRQRLAGAVVAALPPLLLMALTWLLYGGVTRLWWLDDDLFNRILWLAIKGDAPYPGPKRATPLELLY